MNTEDNSQAAIEARAARGLNYSHFGIRLTGQDSERGTFNQRHAVTYDTRTRRVDAHTRNVHPQQARSTELFLSSLFIALSWAMRASTMCSHRLLPQSWLRVHVEPSRVLHSCGCLGL